MSDLLLILVPKEPRISKEVVGKIADILIGLGNISVGSVVVPFLLEKQNTETIVVGTLCAFGCWLLALIILQRYHG